MRTTENPLPSTLYAAHEEIKRLQGQLISQNERLLKNAEKLLDARRMCSALGKQLNGNVKLSAMIAFFTAHKWVWFRKSDILELLKSFDPTAKDSQAFLPEEK